jgi:hypothetical protein
MPEKRGPVGLFIGLLLVAVGHAEVRVYIQNSNSNTVALVNYECTAGEIVRAFALDVSVDRGQIVGITNFFRGKSVAGATGYGIFPAAFRDHIAVGDGTNITWNAPDYTPLAVLADAPQNTLPGLNSSGVTLELGGLWDPTDPSAIPGPAGTLCALILSQPANVSIAGNTTRGGVVSAFQESATKPIFAGTAVGPLITISAAQNGVITVLFTGGELETATAVAGPWTDTGDASGNHTELVGINQTRFYRVRSQ